MRINCIPRPDEPDAIRFAYDLAAILQKDGHDAWVDYAGEQEPSGVGTSQPREKPDLAVIVGGDGSVLHAVRHLSPQVPIIGVNFGRVGFLTDLEAQEAPAFLRRIAREGFAVEKRMRLRLSIDGRHMGDALNEAVIVTERPAKMLKFAVMVDGIAAETFRSDGIILATPTGSTAYAMSAGGPIIDPRIRGYLLVPLAPYMLSSRPHLISADRSLDIGFESDKPASLVLDGEQAGELGDGAIVRVEESPEPAIFVDGGKSFFIKVDRKLRRL